MKTAKRLIPLILACMLAIACAGVDGRSAAGNAPVDQTIASAADPVKTVAPRSGAANKPRPVRIGARRNGEQEEQNEFRPEAIPEEKLSEFSVVELTADFCEFPLYACATKNDGVLLMVYAHSDAGEHVFLRARIALDEAGRPTVRIDAEAGPVQVYEFAAPVKVSDSGCTLTAIAKYGEASDELYEVYPVNENGDPEIWAIPVEIADLEDGRWIVWPVGDASLEENAGPICLKICRLADRVNVREYTAWEQQGRQEFFNQMFGDVLGAEEFVLSMNALLGEVTPQMSVQLATSKAIGALALYASIRDYVFRLFFAAD